MMMSMMLGMGVKARIRTNVEDEGEEKKMLMKTTMMIMIMMISRRKLTTFLGITRLQDHYNITWS